ncbi:MAG: M20/M25/M40 family metallo-hydrolase [Bacteroidetes bacterium]|nr:M20/M25/M40 family metallo-hydrolase [Bacteroidota bacterium]
MLSPENTIQESLELLEALLCVQAYSGEEQDKADLLMKTLQSWGYTPKRQGNNVWLEHHPENTSKTLWFHSHIDTVKPAEGWISNPFGGQWNKKKLTALGSNDAGASVVSMLAAFRILVQEEVPLNLIWVAGAEEENSGKGGVDSMLASLPEADLVLVGEPTGMQAAVAERGLIVIDGVVKGIAGHAARNEGINAIYEALEDIRFFQNYRFEKVSDTLGPVSMNLTVIEAGEKHNSVPDACRYTVDIRLNEHYTHHEVLEELQSHCKGTLKVRSERLKASGTPTNHAVFKVLDKMGISSYGSPTLSDWSLIPYPAVKIGPGDSARSHTAEEYILQNEIEDAVPLYVELIKTWIDEETME